MHGAFTDLALCYDAQGNHWPWAGAQSAVLTYTGRDDSYPYDLHPRIVEENNMEQVVVIERSEFEEFIRLAKEAALALEADKHRDQPELVEVKLLTAVEQLEQGMATAPRVKV